MPTETRANFVKVYTPGLFAVATEEYKRYDETWRQLCSVRSSQFNKEEVSFISGLGVVPQKPEGIAYTTDARLQGYSQTWVHDTYALGVRITEEAIEDDRYGVMDSAARDLGVSARETRHIRVAGIFNAGFGTTIHTAGDDLAIFSASHIRLNNTTWSNLGTAAALNYSSLQAAIRQFEGLTDHRGKKILQTPMILLVPPALEMKAIELLNTVGHPENANNTINAVKQARPRIKLVVWPYLTSSTAWFLIGDNARTETGLIMFERVGVTFARDGDFMTGDALMKVRWRDSIEICNPIGLFGNAGA